MAAPPNTTTTPPPAELTLLSNLDPPSSARTWMSTPHPSLPLLATCCADRSVRVYSLANFRLHSTIAGGHKRSVRAAAWKPIPGTVGKAPTESVLATGSFDASAGIWRRWNGSGDAAAEVVEDENMGGFDVTKGPKTTNGGIAGGLGADDEAVDNEEDEEEEWRFSVVLDGHDSEIKSVAWNVSGTLLATCSRDKSVWIWEALDGGPGGDDEYETVAVLQDHEGDVKCVAWHPEEDLLASASYDDTIRLWREDIDDWTCISVLTGHTSTVWSVDWEPSINPSIMQDDGSVEGLSEEQKTWLARRISAGPRLTSASDDCTVRIWWRVPKERPQSAAPRMPSILRNNSLEEEWVEEACLPKVHDRAVYSVSWSKRTGRIATTGGDGRIVVYEEHWLDGSTSTRRAARSDDSDPAVAAASGAEAASPDRITPVVEQKDTAAVTNGSVMDVSEPADVLQPQTAWRVLADMEGAHGVFEVNHIVWARRWDRGRTNDEEEVLVSTGDDGVVKVWTF